MLKLKQFHDIANDPIAYARQWKTETRGRVVGFFCSYAPEEIIWAAGALPYRSGAGLHPLCGTGVMSFIKVISIPAA